MTMAEALGRLRQQGGRDLERLADALGSEAGLRDALEEWVLNPEGSRSVPAAVPPSLAALFEEGRVGGTGGVAWIDAVWQAWFDLQADVGREVGSRLLPRWAAWETALRLRLARSRGLSRSDGPAAESPEGREDGFGLDAVLAAWDAARARGRGGPGLPAAMEAEELLEQARLEFLDREAPRYSFAVDELAAYLLKLRLLERRQGLDPEKGRALLREAAAL
jgi:hypothetical protein